MWSLPQICRNTIPAEQVLEQVGLGERMANQARLSGGEQRRFNCRALAKPAAALRRAAGAGLQHGQDNGSCGIPASTATVVVMRNQAIVPIRPGNQDENSKVCSDLAQHPQPVETIEW
ncbi:MAG: hypothetical protein ACLSAP_01290 [Oscillospiraceae bacterium]